LTGDSRLSVRIKNATRDIQEDYENALRTVVKLKQKMNELEQRIGQKKREDTKDLNSLRSAADSLDRLTDSQILMSKKAWKTYEEMEHACRAQALQLPQLHELRILCKKTEQLAADLLCYSLGRLKQEKP
jgi:cell division septum initiation protein DivIVA